MKAYNNDIFAYILHQEAQYKKPVRLNDSWDWNMADHIKTSVLYTNSQLLTGKDDFKPVKNITRPILNLQHRTEDIELKDVQIYVNDSSKYHLSFLVKKYHDDVFAVENDLDTFFDDLNISRIDFGGGLSKKLDKPAPEVVPLDTIAFCNQQDILSRPFGLKHDYSPDELLDMEAVGWGDEANGATISIEELIDLYHERDNDTGEGLAVYEVHGNLPKRFADKLDTSRTYETRIFICAFYQKKGSSEKTGVILYTKPEPELPFKLTKRDKIQGVRRALGFGGAEELFEPQVWVNYDMIRMQDMLDAASKTILKSTDPNVAQKNKIRNMENLEIIDIAPNTDLTQVDTFPRNMALFERSVAEWETHAQQMGAANDSIMGNNPSSGTPFKLQELVTQESHGLHEYRRGQFAKHLEEIYYDWIIPHIEKKICEGASFLSELSLEDLQYVSDCLVRNETNTMIKEAVLSGQVPTPEIVAAFQKTVVAEFQKKGNTHFIEILKGEFKNTKLGVKVSVAGKSKNLAGMVDKLTNVFKTITANPYILQSPPIAKLFNKIIEAAGLDPIDLTQLNIPAMPARRLTESVDYKDLASPPNQAQSEMLKMAGIDTSQAQTPVMSK